MPIAALLLALLACGLGQACVPAADGTGGLAARLGAERAGFLVFAAGTFAIGFAVMDVAALTTAWMPPGALALGWVLLRAFTRKNQPLSRPRLGGVSVLLAIGLAEAVARAPGR